MKFQFFAGVIAVVAISAASFTAQAQQKDVNGARNNATDGTSFDTNVSFSLRMTLAGEMTARDSATLGQDVSITTTIRPEAGDIGQPADIIIVDYLPPSLTMRNSDGNFVSWNGSLRTLTPYLEDVSLENDLEVEVFSGQLGVVGNHRIFVGFLVGEQLYFTPSALRFDILEAVASAREQAIALFNSTISPDIVQGRCIVCHVAGGQADGDAAHIFVRTTNSDHLTLNFEELENLHATTSTSYILNKASATVAHTGGNQVPVGSTNYNNFADFLDLLDQAESESAQALLNEDPPTQGFEENDPYAGYSGQ